MVTGENGLYVVQLNGRTKIDTPWYSEAVHEFNELLDNARKSDRVTLWYIKDRTMPIKKSKNCKLLAGVLK